ncbi:cyclohexanone 1,2-monooxygenase [Coccidioides immitis RMSCC 2394]|uniref:Cyclohexanone 1,2-monooxygenase n=1 Tax=Coccidioides immitis RMSCC 2394 TaxID=404692 RepID=A0A0J7AV52_COCIT|nr:cyclohexanone 1,2-monooxygenase [Coccidioides immitis RMSCC 2394]
MERNLSIGHMKEKKLVFDPDALTAEYLAERNKRLRKDGIDQYKAAEGELRHYKDDLYAEPGFQRLAVVEDVDVLIIGGGFGGQLAAAGDFGGAWYWNRYPGAACDIEPYIYMPLLEEMGCVPSEKYVHGPELLEYSRMIGRRYGLYNRALFQTELTGLIWSGPRARWITETSRNDSVRAKFVIIASGPFNKAKLPGIHGIGTFKGHSFHTSRWDYGYTGGDSNGGLYKLREKRVGVIGTGATAIQIIPRLGRSAKHSNEDLVNDGATDILHNLSWFGVAASLNTDDAAKIASELQMLDFKRMEKIRARRPCFSDDYLPTFNLPNVTLVDTDGKGVQKVTENGIVADGKEYELDCIVYATGFQIGTDYSGRMDALIIGEDGRSLTEHWKSGVRTLHGFLTRGFLNCFITSQIQSGFTPNFVYMLSEQAKHVAFIVSKTVKYGIRTLQPTESAEDEWFQTIIEASQGGHQFTNECTPGYFNYEGMTTALILQQGAYRDRDREFVKRLQEWRRTGELPGLERTFEYVRPLARDGVVALAKL